MLEDSRKNYLQNLQNLKEELDLNLKKKEKISGKDLREYELKLKGILMKEVAGLCLKMPEEFQNYFRQENFSELLKRKKIIDKESEQLLNSLKIRVSKLGINTEDFLNWSRENEQIV